jgi:serine protease Do
LNRKETEMFCPQLLLPSCWKLTFALILLIGGVFLVPHVSGSDELSENDLELVRALENQRIAAINKVVGSVIAIYDEDRQGGGSGVIIDSSGIALTNHHVIMGAGVSGWGGLADGNLYPWKLIGTDPGGDVAIIQMEGRDEFPFTPLGDSDQVRVGDWALAMGNPFILTEDQAPTVTLGIVSGVKRYQSGAGSNQLVYGNCIQVDSSINPGNSGGPLFNLQGRVIGINGRGSFQDRGRVNVGLGYAISANQIKNFIPDLLATKLVEHGTLDASFSDRGGKVVCSTINRDAPVAVAGLDLGDELLEFEGTQIYNANQFTNLICTLPEDWPARLKIRKPNGDVALIHVRMFGLPYQQPAKPKRKKKGDKEPTPEEKQKIKRQQEMIELLSAPPGTIRFVELNRKYTNQLIDQWREGDGGKPQDQTTVIKLVDSLEREHESVGKQELWLATDGRFRIHWQMEDDSRVFLFDGQKYFMGTADQPLEEISLVQAKMRLPVVQAISLAAMLQDAAFATQGQAMIDGSDKAMQKNAYRLRVTDTEDDPLFVWLRMYDDETGLPSARLLKASPEKDCNEKGGVTFAQWKETKGTFFPCQREFVRGLEETVFLRLTNQSCQWLDEWEPTLFDADRLQSMETADAKTPESGEDRP